MTAAQGSQMENNSLFCLAKGGVHISSREAYRLPTFDLNRTVRFSYS